MSEENKYNHNIEEEEIEENGNQEEYEEEVLNQVNEEDGQEFSVAFDIQINEGSFILLVGKTDEKKLILRLVDKEDDSKPFYQNEFSLEELREINSIFNNFNNENDIVNYIIKQLNESEKELEIIDDNNIKLSLLINENNNKTQIDFLLLKVAYVLEGEEEIQEITKEKNNIGTNIQKENGNIIEEEGEERFEEEIANLEELNEEGIEEVENGNDQMDNNNDIDNAEHMEEPNMEYSEENLEKSDKKEKGGVEKVINIKKNIIQEQIKSPIKNISKNENALQTIIEDTNENLIMSPESNKNRKEVLIINESKGQKEIQIKKELFNPELENSTNDSKISKIIEQLKDNLDSFGGAMNYLEQEDDDDEENANEEEYKIKKIKKEDLNSFKNEILKTFEKLSENFNNQINKQNNYFTKIQNDLKEESENQIKQMKNELNKKDNQLNEVQNILNKKLSLLENNINEINNELKIKESNSRNKNLGKNEGVSENINKDIEKLKVDFNSKIKEIEQKINDFNKNNKNNENLKTNINSFFEKLNNIDIRLKQSESKSLINNNSINNNINNLDNKIKNFESQLKNIEGLKKVDKEKKLIIDKISNLENKSKIFENQINDLEKNNQNNSQDKQVFEKLNNLEKIVNEIKETRKKTEINLKKNIVEINNSDIINKVNNLINWANIFENKFLNIEKEIKNNNSNLEHLHKRLNGNSLKNDNEIKKDKNQNEIRQNVSNYKSNLEEEPKKEKESSRENLNHRKIKKVKKIAKHIINNSDSLQKEIETKNYRIIKQDNSKSKKYNSQTFNKGNIISSHSVNKNNIKIHNSLEKANIEFQSLTRPRSKSKEHNKNKEIENLANNQSLKSKKYRDINPPIPKEYENSISESKIVEYDDIIFVENRIKDIYPKSNIDFNLVYRASEDGDKSLDFHNKCDKIGPNLTVVKTKNGFIFGGFTVKNWEHLKRDININKPNLGSASRDSKAFGFCVNLQKIYNNERPDEFAIWCNRNFGPTFKNNFFQIFDNCFKKGGYCSVKNNSHFSGQEYDYEISGGESRFGVEDVEVYEILFQ